MADGQFRALIVNPSAYRGAEYIRSLLFRGESISFDRELLLALCRGIVERGLAK